MTKPRRALFIPTYQSAQTVGATLLKIPKEKAEEFGKIYVFDNRSTDQTVQRVQDFVRANHWKNLQVYINDDNYELVGSTFLAVRQALADGFDELSYIDSHGAFLNLNLKTLDLKNLQPLDATKNANQSMMSRRLEEI